jgi:hypothetical protein
MNTYFAVVDEEGEVMVLQTHKDAISMIYPNKINAEQGKWDAELWRDEEESKLSVKQVEVRVIENSNDK